MAIRKQQAGRKAAAAAELAILLPFLGFVFMGVLDFCRAYFCSQTVEAAAHSGAMFASGTSLPPSGTSASAAAQQVAVAEGASLNPPLTTSNVNVSTAGGVATVTVTYDFQMLFGYVGMPSTISIVRTVNMNVAPAPPWGW
jgi:hypothetical protein